MAIPIYVSIHDEIRDAIETGRWKTGDKIPAERELAEQFDVSRMTLRQAVTLLVDEGILERRVGSGTYVAEQKVQERLNGVMSFTEMMAAAGKEASSKTISYHVGKATKSEMEHLNLSDHDDVLRMERVRYGDGEPIAFETASIPARLVADIPRQEITNSLYNALAKSRGLYVGRVQQTVTAAAANERIADLLAIKRAEPVLVMRQLSFDRDEQPFEYVRTQYVGSRFEFYLEH